MQRPSHCSCSCSTCFRQTQSPVRLSSTNQGVRSSEIRIKGLNFAMEHSHPDDGNDKEDHLGWETLGHQQAPKTAEEQAEAVGRTVGPASHAPRALLACIPREGHPPQSGVPNCQKRVGRGRSASLPGSLSYLQRDKGRGQLGHTLTSPESIYKVKNEASIKLVG